jgi:hypothetical protein
VKEPATITGVGQAHRETKTCVDPGCHRLRNRRKSPLHLPWTLHPHRAPVVALPQPAGRDQRLLRSPGRRRSAHSSGAPLRRLGPDGIAPRRLSRQHLYGDESRAGRSRLGSARFAMGAASPAGASYLVRTMVQPPALVAVYHQLSRSLHHQLGRPEQSAPFLR